MLESMPRGARSTPTPPADATSTETVVALDLAKTQTLSDCGELCGPEYLQYLLSAGGYIGQSEPWVAEGLTWGYRSSDHHRPRKR